ncbi:MAG: GAF domain-containing protein [Candidatus Methanofastidiosia archaeon]
MKRYLYDENKLKFEIKVRKMERLKGLSQEELVSKVERLERELLKERRRMEELSLFLKNLKRTTTDLMFRLDSRGRFSFLSRDEVLGYKKEELLSKEFEEILPRYKKMQAKKIVGRILKGEKVENFETEILRKDEGRAWVLVSAEPLFENERICGILGFAKDVTERKRMEKKMQAIYELSREMILATSVEEISQRVLDAVKEILNFDICGIALIDHERKTLRAISYKSSEKHLKIKESPLNGKGITVHVANEGESLNIGDVRKDERYVEGTEGTLSELCVPLKVKGKVIGVLNAESKKMNAFTEEDGKLLGTLAAQAAIAIENAKLLDETHLRLNELKALHEISLKISSQIEMRECLKSIVVKASELLSAKGGGVYLYDESRKQLELVVSYNLGKDYTGTTLKLGEGLSGKIAATGEPMMVKDYRYWEGRSPKFEKTFTAVIGVPLKEGERIVGVLNIIDDVDKRVFRKEDLELLNLFAAQASISIQNAKTYERLQKSYEKLKELDRMKSEFIDVVSRELRNPLTTLMLYIEMLQRGACGELSKDISEKIKIMRANSERLKEIIDQILISSEIKRDKLLLEKKKVSLERITKDVIEELRPLWSEKGQRIKFEVFQLIPKVEIDEGGVWQVIENLLHNAIRYSPEKSTIFINIYDRQDYLQFDVHDEGHGIPEEDLERVFEEFYIVQGKKRRVDGRMGLGLHIAKGIVEKHGGRIWCESTLGLGSSFHFTLPKKNLQPQPF